MYKDFAVWVHLHEVVHLLDNLEHLLEAGDLQAQDFTERLAAKTITKAQVFAHYGWDKPESEKKARTIIRQWDPTIIEWLDAMEMKADEWLKELALTNYQAQMYQ